MRKLLGSIALAAMLAVPSQAEAQLTLGAGAAFHGNFDFGVGVWGMTPMPSIHENVSIGGDFTFFFPDDGGATGVDFSYFEINPNLFYSFTGADASFTPFALAGVNIARFSVDSELGNVPGVGSSSTDVGLNLGGGISFGSGDSGVTPVVGAKLELGGGEDFVIFGGIGFPVGG